MKIESIGLKSGSLGKKDSIGLKLGDKDNSISLKISNKKSPKEEVERKSLSIEMTSDVLFKEAEAFSEGKSIWPTGISVTGAGRIRMIEADSPEEIDEIELWAEIHGMKCQ